MRNGLRRRSRPEPAEARGTRIIVEGGADPDDRPERQRPRVGVEEVNAFVMRLITRHGSAEHALERIAGEQLKYRHRAQDAEHELEELQKRLPAAGSVVLTGDDAKAFQELKTKFPTVKVAELSAQLSKLQELETKDSRSTRETTLKLAAGDKYKPKVLAKLVGDLPIEFKTVLAPDPDDEDETVEVKIPYIKVGDTLEKLDGWLSREHEEWLDVVTIADDEGEGRDGGRRESRSSSKETGKDTRRESPGPRMPKPHQSGGQAAKGGKGSTADVFKAVDRGMSGYATPSQMRKAANGGT